MRADFRILGSSSHGNCALLRTERTRILIDAGFSAKRIGALLAAVGETVDGLDAIFLTHEHNDHAQGMRGLVRRLAPHVPVFANRDTAEAVQGRLRLPVNWRVFETGAAFAFRDLTVRSFSLPHDAYDPVGFTFRWGEEGDLLSPAESLAWVVDLGHIPAHVREHVSGVETLVIEANYDERMLESDQRRPWSTKQRIRGRHGHLSNDSVFDLLEGLNGSSRLREVYLAHLSRDCNAVDMVRRKFAGLAEAGAGFKVSVVDPALGAAPAPEAPGAPGAVAAS